MDDLTDTPPPPSSTETNLPPGPVVEGRSSGKLWLFVALVIVAILIFLGKGMI